MVYWDRPIRLCLIENFLIFPAGCLVLAGVMAVLMVLMVTWSQVVAVVPVWAWCDSYHCCSVINIHWVLYLLQPSPTECPKKLFQMLLSTILRTIFLDTLYITTQAVPECCESFIILTFPKYSLQKTTTKKPLHKVTEVQLWIAL